MAYRDDSEPLHERYASLTEELEQTRAHAQALSSREAALAKELEDLRTRLVDGRRHLPAAKLRIASPCSASWEAMFGDERTRFCGECQKQVHDLTKMSAAEVDLFLLAHSGGACVRIFERADGRVLTEDCPVGVRRRRARALVASMLGTGACALLALTAVARVMTSEIAPFEVRGVREVHEVGDLRDGTAPARAREAREAREHVPHELALMHPRTAAAVATPTASHPFATGPAAMGFVWLEAQEGTRIYEGERFLGTAPLMFPVPEGTHLFRAVDPRTGAERTMLGIVRDGGVATLHLDPPGGAPEPAKPSILMGDTGSDADL